MCRPQHRRLDGRTREVRPQQHLRRRPWHFGEMQVRQKTAFESLPGLERQQPGKGAAFIRHVTFDRVGEGIVAGQRRHLAGGCRQQIGIEDHLAETRLAVAAGHLHVAFRLRNQREPLRVAARTGGGRNADRRQHRALDVAVAPIILHAATTTDEEIEATRRVECRTAAECDETVGRVFPGGGGAFFDLEGIRVLPGVGKNGDGDAGRFEPRGRPVGMPGGQKAGIGDQQNAPQTEPAGELR